MREVCDHRNRCDRCGLSIPGIAQRAGQAKHLVRTGASPERIQKEAEQNHLVPADAPERMLFPAQAKQLDTALQALGLSSEIPSEAPAAG